ncbi:MAG: AAA family ATPase [Mycobacteriales bacterium]|nr:AAA family ATPase [Mycobacteriales bacterium]
MLTLTAVQRLAGHERSRGIVRVSAAALALLGARHLDLVLLTGARATGALVAPAPDGTPGDVLLCDELMLANLGVADGTAVTVELAGILPAQTVVVAGPPEVVAVVDPALLRSALHGKAVTTGDAVMLLPQELEPAPDFREASKSLRNRLGFQQQAARLSVLEVHPPGPVLVGPGTAVRWEGGPSTLGALPVAGAVPAAPAWEPTRGPVPAGPAVGVPFQAAPASVLHRVEDLPGLESQVKALTEWLDLGFHHRDLLATLGTPPSMGVLVTGAAGSGKAALVEAVCTTVGARLMRAWGPALASLEPNAAAREITTLLSDAARSAPAVVLIEDVEALAPRDGSPLLPTFLTAIRDVVRDGRVAVVCTTAAPEKVTAELRSPGTLDHELSVPLPDKAQRQRLLEHATRAVPLDTDVSLADVAGRTPGFVAADLLALVKRAALEAAGRQRDAAHPVVTAADLDAALDVVRPTSMEGTSLDLASLTLDDVGDMETVKAALTEAVLWPLQYPDTFSRLGVSAPRGVLLYGPPGCGKTFLVKAIAGSGQVNVLSVKGAEVLSKWVGESEASVRELFRRAREAAPTLVFLDEVDALAPTRGQSTDGGTTDRVVAALLTELDGVESLRDVVVIGATNRPDLIDPALLRPGRLERLVFVPPPDAEARAAILKAASKKVPLAPDVDLAALAARTDGYSAADCAALVREAALGAMRESMEAATVTLAHLEAALLAVRPSLDPAQVEALATYAERRAAR